jgi:hypothetical protein
MSNLFEQRLNAILPRLLKEDLLRGRGIGNEIGFYVFDYPPEQELVMRQRRSDIVRDITKQRPDLRVADVNLFYFILDHLRERGLLDLAIEKQRIHGDAALRSALKGPLHPEKLAAAFAVKYPPENYDLALLSGIGSAFPLIRSHSMLNNLHTKMDGTPLVMFYPGKYDGTSLQLFNILNDENYYRAFPLV